MCRMRVVFICILLFFFQSCDKGSIQQSANTIKIVDCPSVNLTDLFSKIELIPLETNDNSILGSFKNLIVVNSKFYIRDSKQSQIAVFNLNGDFIFSTKNQIGKGPGDYLNCSNYIVVENTGNIQILDQMAYEIKEYKLNGEFVRKIKFPEEFIDVTAFCYISDGIYGFYFSHRYDVGFKENIVFYSVKEGQIIKKIDNISELHLCVCTNPNPFFKLNDTINFSHTFPSNLIYYLDIRHYID